MILRPYARGEGLSLFCQMKLFAHLYLLILTRRHFSWMQTTHLPTDVWVCSLEHVLRVGQDQRMDGGRERRQILCVRVSLTTGNEKLKETTPPRKCGPELVWVNNCGVFYVICCIYLLYMLNFQKEITLLLTFWLLDQISFYEGFWVKLCLLFDDRQKQIKRYC